MPYRNNTLISLSRLAHTWLIDLDGTILRHNGHLDDKDELLPGIREFWGRIPKDDFIILLSARSSKYRKQTIAFLQSTGIRYNKIIFDLPKGERFLINDQKPKGLNTAIALNLIRDEGLQNYEIIINEEI